MNVSLLRKANAALREKKYDIAYQAYQGVLVALPNFAHIVNFNIELMRRRGFILDSNCAAKKEIVDPISLPQVPKKIPITVLIITWDVGHNCLGRSYMLAEVVQRIARHTLLVGFQFPKYGESIWEPVREGRLPVVTLPGGSLPEFCESLQNIGSRIKPDVVVACKPRLPSLALAMVIKEKWGCPLILDIDDHELSFFSDQTELSLKELASRPAGSAANDTEPYAELWTRLSQGLCKYADEIVVSNVALQAKFGGTIIPHVRDENVFAPEKYDKLEARRRHGVPANAKVVLFFGTPRSHKGIDTLARAVNAISDPSFLLLVVGAPPDKSVYAKLDQLAPGRIAYLPNQAFAAIPEIVAMADVVCLPQDNDHAISKFQLPAKAIDAVAMGVPLLVSDTPPLRQLVDDQVAELISSSDVSRALESLIENKARLTQWRKDVRSRFLHRYSYAAAAVQMHDLIVRCLSRKSEIDAPSCEKLFGAIHHVLGTRGAPKVEGVGVGVGFDIVLFWKQNDTGLYGRRHDMVVKYLASRPDVRKVVVFDAPVSEHDLIQRQQSCDEATQHRWIYVRTYEKLLGKHDSEKISYNVFVHPPGRYRSNDSDAQKPALNDDYFSYVRAVLKRERVHANESIFWIYPRNYLAPALVDHFKPAKVVVDVVDDHRAWPGIGADEHARLTKNYIDTLAKADMAFVNCEPMHEAMRGYYPGVRLVPNGCDLNPPNHPPHNNPAFNDFKSWKGKTIGFIGNLERKIDIPLLQKIAEKFPDCRVVLVGSTHANPAILELKKYPNVHFAGVVPYDEIGAWISRFDVGIIPHLNLEMTQRMNPLKLYVYLSWKVPVVSMEIFNVDRTANFVHVADSHDEFMEQISNILTRPMYPTPALFDYIAQNSWEKRFKSHVDELLIGMEKIPAQR